MEFYLKLFAENGGFPALVTAVLLIFIYRFGNKFFGFFKQTSERSQAINDSHAKAANTHAAAATALADAVGELANGLKKNHGEIIDHIDKAKDDIIKEIKS